MNHPDLVQNLGGAAAFAAAAGNLAGALELPTGRRCRPGPRAARHPGQRAGQAILAARLAGPWPRRSRLAQARRTAGQLGAPDPGTRDPSAAHAPRRALPGGGQLLGDALAVRDDRRPPARLQRAGHWPGPATSMPPRPSSAGRARAGAPWRLAETSSHACSASRLIAAGRCDRARARRCLRERPTAGGGNSARSRSASIGDVMIDLDA